MAASCKINREVKHLGDILQSDQKKKYFLCIDLQCHNYHCSKNFCIHCGVKSLKKEVSPLLQGPSSVLKGGESQVFYP